MISRLDWLSNMVSRVSHILGYVAGQLLLLLVVLITVSVLFRYMVAVPLAFVDEVVGYLLLGIFFLGLSYTLLTDGHIRVRLVLSRLHGRVLYVWQLVLLPLGIGFAVVVLLAALVMMRDYWTLKVTSPQVLATPLIYPCALMVIGALWLVLQFLDLLYHTIRSLPRYDEE